MKIPGIKKIIGGLKHIFQKFPVESSFTVLSTLMALSLVNSFDQAYHYPKWILEDGLMTLHISILFFLGLNLLIKFSGSDKRQINPLLYLFLLIPALLFLYFRDIEKGTTQVWIQYGILNFTGHLWVASVAFIVDKGQLGYFWSFNKRIFLRLLSSVFYSLVLYLGISLAFLALQYLFGLEVENTFYVSLGIWTGLLFNTFYFLGGIPTSQSDLLAEEKMEYPKSLKYFTQYVLIPLLSLYLIILLSYEIKLFVQWTLPKGWVSEMILAYAGFGILSLLLVHPIKNKLESRWIKAFSRYYSYSLIPLSILFFLALYRRISDYGFTEDRYILLFLSFWVFGISLFLIIKKDYQIRFIPISLWILALVGLFNPWNLFETTKNSQINRFEKSLKEKKFIGKTKMNMDISKNMDIRNHSLKEELFYYLYNRYSYKPFQKLVKTNLDSLNIQYSSKSNKKVIGRYGHYKTYSDDSIREYLVNYFHLNKPLISDNEKNENPDHQINFTGNSENRMIYVKGWDYYTSHSLNNNEDENFFSTDTLLIERTNNLHLVISQFSPYQSFIVKLGKDVITLSLKTPIHYLNTLKPTHPDNMYYNIDLDDLSLDENTFRFMGENEHYKIQISILSGIADFNKDSFKMKNVDLGIYVRNKLNN